MSDDVTNDLFHNCAVWAYFEAKAEGKQDDSNYVKRLAYEHYERELRERNHR